MPYKSKEDRRAYSRNRSIKERASIKNRAAAEGISATAYIRRRWGDYYACARLAAYSKRRSRKTGIENTITGKYLLELLKKQKGTCPLTGVKLRHGAGMVPDTMSLDRINQKLGYVPGNVRIVCWWANTSRGSMSDLKFLRWCEITVKHLKGNLP